MKILAVVSTLDLRYRLGCTPAWWQILKGLYETENEVVAVPYLGRDIESLWWRTYPNAWRVPGDLMYLYSRTVNPKKPQGSYRFRDDLIRLASNGLTRGIWHRHLTKILRMEKDFDALVFFNVPLNQISGIPLRLGREFSLKTAFYDGDMPTILPEHASDRGFMFDYYRGADLSDVDLFLVNSEGVANSLIQRGARKVVPIHYAADPELFYPIPVEKRWDIAFFGYGSQYREKWMTRMISEPSDSKRLNFAVGGNGFGIDLGRATQVGDVPLSMFRRFCSEARINLNITRESHTNVFGSSTARPFELAAMGCCIVSCPYNGLEKWFQPKKEITILSENDNPADVYAQLLADPEYMIRMGKAARERSLREHTYKHRAIQMVTAISCAKAE